MNAGGDSCYALGLVHWNFGLLFLDDFLAGVRASRQSQVVTRGPDYASCELGALPKIQSEYLCYRTTSYALLHCASQ